MDLSQTNEAIEEHYFLLGRMEILNCLNTLIRERVSLTVYFNEGKDFCLTSLLEAGPEHLLFDLGGDEKANRRLERANGCTLVAVHDGIKVQFSIRQGPQRCSWGGADAFKVPLPTRVIRLQRRESYRVVLPVNKPVVARLTSGDLVCEVPIHDLSAGGAGLIGNDEVKLADGDEVEVTFLLIDGRLIRSDAQIRHITSISSAASHQHVRVGLCFINMPQALNAKVQRYILQVEHQRNILVRKE